MPNWTENTLRFAGPHDQIDRVRDLLQGDESALDFERVAPMPPVLKRVVSPVRAGPEGRAMLRREGTDDFAFDHVEATPEEQAAIDACAPHDNWYDWSVANWGTKWPPSEVARMRHQPNVLEYEFSTAWDAPRAFYDAMLARVREVAPDVRTTAEAVHEDGQQHEVIL